MKKIIGFDLDGVIIDNIPLKVQMALEKGWNIKKEQAPSDILKTIIPNPALGEIKQCVYADPEISLRPPLMIGAKDGLREIKGQGLPYFLISRRKAAQQAVELLRLRGLWPKYFNENNSFFVLEPEDKNIKAKELGITHYIDDEISVLEKLTDVENKFLFDVLDVFQDADYYARFKSWGELMNSLSL